MFIIFSNKNWTKRLQLTFTYMAKLTFEPTRPKNLKVMAIWTNTLQFEQNTATNIELM